MQTRPLAIELFCGKFGWTQGWLKAGGHAVGFDIEHLPHHGPVPAGAELVLQDVLTLHGSQFRNASVIFASPPCQDFSSLAMPFARSVDWVKPSGDGWEVLNSRARKEMLERWKREGPDRALFDACFRIQREASEAAGRYIPLIVENVRGAVPWVGRPKANFGSFLLWGDIAQVGKRIVRADAGFGSAGLYGGKFKGGDGSWFAVANNTNGHSKNPVHELTGQKSNPDGTNHPTGSWFRIADSSQGDRGLKVPGFRFDGSGRSFQTASVKATGVKGNGGMWFGPVAERGDPRAAELNADGTRTMPDGTKIGGDWFSDPKSTCRKHGSRSQARKAASAQIAMIPPALSDYVAEMFWPT